jgi:iron-sulfur cluster repair protein YtfE (RIC family)
MDATKLLEHQHREVEKLFEKFEAAEAKEKHALATLLAQKLLAHMVIEQTIFYPTVFRGNEEAIHEAYEEHHVARGQVMRVLAAEFDDPSDDAKVTALKELIEHHVDEEEKELFPNVRRAHDSKVLAELGATMKREFEALVERRPRTIFARAEACDVLADVTEGSDGHGKTRSLEARG